jgi:hypothetical protein
MPSLRKTIQNVLKNPIYEQTYNERVSRYGNLSEFVPVEYSVITNGNKPWFVHGLAFRMATYSLENDIIFQRLNNLIEIAKRLDGWENELKNTGLSWSYNYDEFFHFLWMLQCMEYFLDKDFAVRFSGTTKRKHPDLTVEPRNKGAFFAECYVYSKWWFKEAFLEDIVRLLHPNLRIERIYNLKSKNKGNTINELLDDIGNVIAQDKLEAAEKEAAVRSPYLLKESGGIRLVLEGAGEYQASTNAHGDPVESANAYLNEIVKYKEKKNDLKSHRPNVLRVNGLGVDFQNIFTEGTENLSFESFSIDKVVLFACGIDAKISECHHRHAVVH